MAANPRHDADAGPEERVLVITRTFDAPRGLVFKLWTDPSHAMRWMGPRGFTATHVATDPRPGGAWRVCLRREENGEELWHGGIYREVVEPERLVFTHAWDGEDGRPGHETIIAIGFAERQGKTTMTFRQSVFSTIEARDRHNAGWSSAFDRLADSLASVG